MNDLGRAAAIGLGLLFGLAAQADDGSVDLDTVDSGKTRTLHAVDVGETHALDAADSGHSDSLDSADTGRTHRLDSVDDGTMHDQDAVDTGRTLRLDAAETDVPARIAAPAPVPDAGSAAERAQAEAIREDAVLAATRLDGANAAYSEMLARGYPTGDARAVIVEQRDTARRAYEQAHARYTAFLEQIEGNRSAE
jgi:hypothetical protein